MNKYFQMIFDWKALIITVLAIIAFSNFMTDLFGQTIPNIIMTFFKGAGEYVILGAVFIFALAWLLRAKPHNRPKQYMVVIFDIFSKRCNIDGIRTRFTTHDVAWSYMRFYKKKYPLYNFALISNDPKSKEKPTIFRYI